MIDFPAFVREHSPKWCRDAAALARVVAPCLFSLSKAYHVVDAALLPEHDGGDTVAFTIPGLGRLIDPAILLDRREGPATVVDVLRCVERVERSAGSLAPSQVADACRLEVCQVAAMHELAHVVVAAATNAAPVRADLADVLTTLPTRQPTEQWLRGHGAQWVRAYLHLSGRAAAVARPREWWLDVARHDIAAHGIDENAVVVELLADEVRESQDEPLVDVLRRDPPAPFLDALTDRLARRDRRFLEEVSL